MTEAGQHSIVERSIGFGVGASLALGGVACGEQANPHSTVKIVDVSAESSTTTTSQAGLEGGLTIHDVTDSDLSHGGYNCGHAIEEGQDFLHYNYGNQIDYLNTKPELIKNVADFVVNDPKGGMGKAAWEVIKSQAYKNADTSADKKVSASNSEHANRVVNTYSHLIHALELPTAHEYLNYTCSNAQGDITPIHEASLIRIKETNHVGGFILDSAGLRAFRAVVKKDAHGNMAFDVIDLGMQDVPGQTEQKQLFMVVTEAEGCNNQERLIPPELRTPETPETTPTTLTLVAAPPNRPPKIILTPKTDTPTGVPGPGGGTPQHTPPPEGDPTPDDGSANPVGGTETNSTTSTTIPGVENPTTTDTPTTTSAPRPIPKPGG